jgi:hypothetical protein
MTDATSSSVGYEPYVRFILRMYRLTKDGKFESAEADAAREEIEGVWNTLSEVEKQRLRGLSLDLKHMPEVRSKLRAAIPRWS